MADFMSEELENRRQNMIASCQRVASALADCAQQFNDFAALVPGSTTGLVDFPATSLASLAAQASGQALKEKKPRKKREKKDPDAPKRPPSAYLLFQNEKMQQLRDDHKDLSYRDVLKLVAEKWKGLDEEEKKIYVEAYGHANDTFKDVDAEYKRNKEGALAIANAAAENPIPDTVSDTGSSDDSSEDSEDEDDSDESSAASPVALPPPVVTPAKAIKPKKNAAVATPARAPAPVPVVAPATVESSAKKDKKRKNKEVEAVGASTPMTEEKKKKKKTKE